MDCNIYCKYKHGPIRARDNWPVMEFELSLNNCWTACAAIGPRTCRSALPLTLGKGIGQEIWPWFWRGNVGTTSCFKASTSLVTRFIDAMSRHWPWADIGHELTACNKFHQFIPCFFGLQRAPVSRFRAGGWYSRPRSVHLEDRAQRREPGPCESRAKQIETVNESIFSMVLCWFIVANDKLAIGL